MASPEAEQAITRALAAAGLKITEKGEVVDAGAPAKAMTFDGGRKSQDPKTAAEINAFLDDALFLLSNALKEGFPILGESLNGEGFFRQSVPEYKVELVVMRNATVTFNGAKQENAVAALEAAVTRIAKSIKAKNDRLAEYRPAAAAKMKF